MGRFRDIKRKARRQLHRELADVVIYVPEPTGTPQTATVRLHLGFDALGEIRRSGFAEQQEYDPRAVFLLSQLTPRRGGFIVTADMGVWRVDNTLPPDDITMTAEIIHLSASQIRGLGWNPEAPWAGFPPPAGTPPVDPGHGGAVFPDSWEIKQW